MSVYNTHIVWQTCDSNKSIQVWRKVILRNTFVQTHTHTHIWREWHIYTTNAKSTTLDKRGQKESYQITNGTESDPQSNDPTPVSFYKYKLYIVISKYSQVQPASNEYKNERNYDKQLQTVRQKRTVVRWVQTASPPTITADFQP